MKEERKARRKKGRKEYKKNVIQCKKNDKRIRQRQETRAK